MTSRAQHVAKWAILALLVVVVAQVTFFQASPHVRGPAPVLALTDLRGTKVDLSAYRGKAVAVNFWASWCEPCRAELPDLVQVREDHKSDCFEMLGVAVNSGETADVAAFAQKHGITYPVLLDDDATSERWHVEGLPTTFLIDPKGNVTFSYSGALSRGRLERELKPLIPPRVGAGC